MPLNDEDRDWIRAELASLAGTITETKTAIKEAVYESETRLLTAFHKWASPMEQKVRSQREALRALDLQIEEIASRVQRLEANGDTRH
jgi:hypothetical protein